MTIDYRDTVFLPKTDFPMKAGLPQKEPGILARWQAEGLYEKLREIRKGREKFILHDGPPYANGDMHIGHALNHILKDMVVRTQSLLGKDAPYVPGWDCHGLPIEWKVEEAYRKKKLNKDEVPAAEFRAECRAYAQGWVDVQREQLKRLGINADWDHPYLTMDFAAEATIVAELMKFAESGQLYRGAKPVMWSPVEKTALAEAEVEYEDIVSTQIDVAFEIVESPIPELVGAHAVIWTTTPWTIPANQALAYGPEVEYEVLDVFVEAGPGKDGRADDKYSEYEKAADRLRELGVLTVLRVVIARELIGNFLQRLNAEARKVDFSDLGIGWVDVIASATGGNWFFKGSKLAGTVARHPMHHLGGFFAKPRPFLPGDFVTTEQGTGLVHMAPDHGEDDFELCKANGIEPVFAVEGDGTYRADWAWLGGQGSVINAKFNAPDGPICEALRAAGALLAASADYKHSYPHSWRSKAKLIFRATPQWFIPMDQGERSLRDTALQAIKDTRWVPEKGQNRITAMVEGRPDWVISRQRAWGVPITLFVDRKSGQYLNDPQVNARIVAAVRENGVDAWTDEAAQGFLGPDRDPADYERVTDILDVWFDSGCTHAFVLEGGKWPDLQAPADLYLEGSDQHRGWFQSSLLESCGTRGRAPYKAVLTHGFTMDAKGMKMSKSLGNTINPLDLMKESGADILRLWALSVDFTEDHRIGKEILSGVSDQYRKLRNTFRYLLGALEGFEAEKQEKGTVPFSDMPELERYILHLLAEMDGKLKAAVADFDFNTYTRLLSDFANNDLSAFFFDIRKDCLYCEVNPATGYQTTKRRAYRTVLDILFHALVRYAAPVLVFTAEEVWGTRFPEEPSVHLLEWPQPINIGREIGREQPEGEVWLYEDGVRFTRWSTLRDLRSQVSEAIEPLRREKVVGSSLEVEVSLPSYDASPELAELFISGVVSYGDALAVAKTAHHKCGRCWRHLPEVTEDGALCARCTDVLND
jgi:isoleucyl-tRNA synthetase